MLRVENGAFVREFGSEKLRIEAWGRDGLRLRSTILGAIDESRDWALLPKGGERADIRIEGETALVRNGGVAARVSAAGRISFLNRAGELLLEERWRNREVPGATYNATNVPAREYRPNGGGSFRLAYRFEAVAGEKLYGMGQYQDGCLDLKGCVLELAQRNSQASVPFLLSSRGYGLLWNNPAIGRASFGKNFTEWSAERSSQLDIWVTAGETPARIEESYASVTGRVPMMPEFAMGFWQCKLRYKTQEELLAVAREYKRRGLPISVIVSDFFHWPMQGEWKFDPRYWPDPEAMVGELKEMGIELMVSIWPTVDKRSENFKEMADKGYLVRAERGIATTMDFMGDCVFFDATNPAAREYVWAKAKKNYYDKGIKLFWLDEAEPEYSVYDFDNYRYHSGSVMETGNAYPVGYAQAFYEGLVNEGHKDAINLLRCAWAGSQRYGALVWSGDIDTTFASFRAQFAAGLNMGLAGIPWWTTDIGGFGGGDPDSPAYRELLVRWFQYGTFCPVFRLHGFRVDNDPKFKLVHTEGSTSEDVFSGGPNEVWSYGEEAYGILERYLFVRERLRPYIRGLMAAAHEKGTPVMRPLFYDFPTDAAAWEVTDQYMFGPDLLVAPILSEGQRRRPVYLPAGASWKDAVTGTVHAGGTTIEREAALDTIPIFLRDGAAIKVFG
jgi:alpha-D-xyloside xylohydrolase